MAKAPRPPIIRGAFDGELVVDNFAGGGGASTGIEAVLGRPVDFAINHNPEAIAVHKANHPETKHYCENIWDVDPRDVAAGRRVGLAWFSPDCKHFSRAKGGPLARSKEIRALAWVVIRWASLPPRQAPRVIVVENVEEFQTWGPLDEDGAPVKAQAGETFREWLCQLQWCGYHVELKSIVAADHDTPTTRRRLFIVARRDGAGIAWPEPTNGPGRARPHRPAAEVIDWSIPCPSIFGRQRPLADATMRRIARGLERFVLRAPRPFIVPLTHHNDARTHDLDEPLRTVTAVHRGEFALVSPYLIQTSYGEREGQAPRVLDLHRPLGTVVAGGQKHGLCAAFLSKHYGGNESPGSHLGRAIDTITAQDHHALTAAWLTKLYGTSTGADVRAPLPTVTASGQHLAAVRAFLVKFYGTGGAVGLDEPLDTVTTHDRFGLVMVDGEPYRIVDIGMRMLQPHELFAAQGFPATYKIAPDYNGKPLSKTAQIALAGNSVCPPVAAAIVGANARAA